MQSATSSKIQASTSSGKMLVRDPSLPSASNPMAVTNWSRLRNSCTWRSTLIGTQDPRTHPRDSWPDLLMSRFRRVSSIRRMHTKERKTCVNWTTSGEPPWSLISRNRTLRQCSSTGASTHIERPMVVTASSHSRQSTRRSRQSTGRSGLGTCPSRATTRLLGRTFLMSRIQLRTLWPTRAIQTATSFWTSNEKFRAKRKGIGRGFLFIEGSHYFLQMFLHLAAENRVHNFEPLLTTHVRRVTKHCSYNELKIVN